MNKMHYSIVGAPYDQRQRDRISLNAFFQQLQNWELRKLKALRMTVTDKFRLNQIEIVATQIQGQLIRHRKLREKYNKSPTDCEIVIQDYNNASKKFMDIIQKIGQCLECENQEQYIEEETQSDQLSEQQIFQETRTKNKSFLQETFAHQMIKQHSMMQIQDIKKSSKRTESEKIFLKTKNMPSQSRRSSVRIQDCQKGTLIQSKFGNHSRNRGKIGNQNSVQNQQSQKPGVSSSNKLQLKAVNKSTIYGVGYNGDQNSNQNELWDIRYQLSQIKSMMTQIQNEINFHSHQSVDLQINKLQHQNKKMMIQLKGLKQDNRTLLGRVQLLKQQIGDQKKAQASMVKEFERPSRHSDYESASPLNQERLSASSKTMQGDVSDWVRVRI